MMERIRQELAADHTTWHITFGTYGARLHGGDRPTVDKVHNEAGQPFVDVDPERMMNERTRMGGPVMVFSLEQQRYTQRMLPGICDRGGWGLRTCAAGPDHVHVLVDVIPSVHGEKVRRLIKRWLGQMLSERFGRPSAGTWWAEEGSNRAIHDATYLNNAFDYVSNQRAC